MKEEIVQALGRGVAGKSRPVTDTGPENLAWLPPGRGGRMRYLVTFLLASVGVLHPARADPASDRAAILAILQDSAADEPNAHVSPSLDWENAFGIRYTNLRKRDAFFGEIVAPLQKGGNDKTLEIKMVFVHPDVAVADEYWHRVGQLDISTRKPGPDRWGRTTYIFTRGAGQWTEVLERVADLRYAYYHHYDALPKAVPVPPALLSRYAGTYAYADDHSTRTITVDGDHLTVASPKRTRIAIPVSESDFLLFDPDDLAEYRKLHFVQDEKNGTSAIVSDEAGDVGGTLLKLK